MKMVTKISYAFMLALMVSACHGGASKAETATDAERSIMSSNTMVPVTGDDEKDFRRLLETFKTALVKKDFKAAASLMHFPFYTSNGSQGKQVGAAEDPILFKEFSTYQSDIFNTDVLRLLPKYTEQNLSEIDDKTDDTYYKSLKKKTEQGSKLYEIYFQYPESDTQAESFFGFVFGKIDGKYQAIASYAKWPIK